MTTSRLSLRALTILLFASASSAVVWSEATGPNDDERKAAEIVTRLMERGHISRHLVDDEISQRMFKAYLNVYDPLKQYLLATDIDEFQAQANKLDDDVRTGGARLTFAFQVYNRFLERLDQAVEWAHEFADAEHDFTAAETIVVDPDTAQYAANADELKDRWRARLKYEICNLIIDGKTPEEARDRIHRRYRNLKSRWHDLQSSEVVELYLSTLTSSFDPHSTYMSPDTLEDFEIHMRLSLEGIGALLQEDDGSTVVKEIVAGGAAEKDGRLKPGDEIVGVGEGKEGELEDIVQMRLRDVVKRIRGAAGTTVRLEVVPDGEKQRVVYDLIRQRIELKDQAAKGEVIEFPDAGTGVVRKIGVITLPSFYADQGDGELFANIQKMANLKTATNDCKRILDEFKAQGVEGVVMDLRTNGGGLLTEAINLTGLFITEGPIVQVRDFDNKVSRYPDTDDSIAYDGPLAVLVSRFSASASEIFAGAIKDYHRGIVIGDTTTHGKGTVQKVLDLKRQIPQRLGEYGALKLTMQQFYRVNGQSTQNRGVPADIVLPSKSDNDDFGEASLDYALEFSEIDPADFQPAGSVNDAVIAQLRELSADRFAKNPELSALVAKKTRFEERKSRKSITFTEETLRAEREEVDKDSDKTDDDSSDSELDVLANKKDEKFGTDTYSKEVLQIMADFLRIENVGVAAGAPRGS